MKERGEKLKKKFLLVLFFLGLFCSPTISQAAPPVDFDITVPERTGHYVRFLDHEGNPFPDPITTEATEMRTWGPPTGVSGTVKIVNNDPVDFTTSQNSNIFYYNTSKYEYTGLKIDAYYNGIVDWKINIPGNYVKYFSTTPPPGVTPVPDLHLDSSGLYGRNAYEQKSSTWSKTTHDFTVWSGSAWTAASGQWTEQSDGSYLLTQGRYFTAPTSKVAAEIGYSLVTVNVNATVKASAIHFGTDGQGMTVYAYNKEIKELFEDETGSSIDAPDGYTNGKTTGITSNPFTYTMENGDKLPKTYSTGTQLYSYQGWYKGSGNKVSMNTDYPPNITFDAEFDESKDEVHIVYKKVNSYNLVEKYQTESGAQIDPSWDQTVLVERNTTYTEQPDALKTDSSGKVWEYQGWKLSTDPAGTKKTDPVSVQMNGNKQIHYIYSEKRHNITEKWVDANSSNTLLNIPTNPDTTKKAETDGTYISTPTASITDNDGVSWEYTGWENVTDDPGTVHPATTPVSLTNIQDDIELKYHYTKKVTTATLSLSTDNEIVNNNSDVIWAAMLTNTGSYDLTNIVLKKTDAWAQGLAKPEGILVSVFGSTDRTFPISDSEWENGLSLENIVITPGTRATILLVNTKATGTHNQVLPAEIEVQANLAAPLKADGFVRIDDPDEPNLKQTDEVALINIPDFKFGTTGMLVQSQTKGLAVKEYIRNDYYPYIRFRDQSTSGDWALSVQLGTFSDGTNTLPNDTSITLKQGSLKKVTNYNKETEALQTIGSVTTKTLVSNQTSVALLDSSDKGVYQLEYDLSDVELNLGNTSGVSVGKKYTAQLTWDLSTGP